MDAALVGKPRKVIHTMTNAGSALRTKKAGKIWRLASNTSIGIGQCLAI
jgi:hypothetical protein